MKGEYKPGPEADLFQINLKEMHFIKMAKVQETQISFNSGSSWHRTKYKNCCPYVLHFKEWLEADEHVMNTVKCLFVEYADILLLHI